MTKTEIFKLIVERMTPNAAGVLSIDEELLGVLRDLSIRGDHLQTTATITTAAGTGSYAVPTNFLTEAELTLSGRLRQITFGEAQAWLGDDQPVYEWSGSTTYGLGEKVFYANLTWVSQQVTNLNHTPAAGSWWQEETSGRGEPEAYAIWNDRVYLRPVPDGVYIVTVYYSYCHGSDLSTLDLNDRYREVVCRGVMAALWCGQLMQLPVASNQWVKMTQLYEDEIVRLNHTLRPVSRAVRYRDL